MSAEGNGMAGSSASAGGVMLGGLFAAGTDGSAGMSGALSTLANGPGSAFVEGGSTTAGGTSEGRSDESDEVLAPVSGGSNFLGEITISDRGRSVSSGVRAGSEGNAGADGSLVGSTGTGRAGAVDSETGFSMAGTDSTGGCAFSAGRGFSVGDAGVLGGTGTDSIWASVSPRLPGMRLVDLAIPVVIRPGDSTGAGGVEVTSAASTASSR